MKKLLFLLIFIVVSIAKQSQAQIIQPAILQAPVFFDGFELWGGTPLQPTVWMQTPATTMTPASVVQSYTTITLPPEQGNYSCNLQNTTTTYSYMATVPVYSVTVGMAYQISYYVRGQGDISSGISISGTNTMPAGELVSGKTWRHILQSVIAPSTATNTAFFLKVKSTGIYAVGADTIKGIDVDSFCVRPYTPVTYANLFSLQYTSDTTGNSPFWGQTVGLTGGIVTAVQNGSAVPQGYYIQNTGATMWAAMLVYDYINAALVNVGDSITFGGTVEEVNTMTEMNNITNFTDVSTSSGMHYTITPNLITTTSINQEPYEATLVDIQWATVNSYTPAYGQATISDATAGTCFADLKDGFYPPNGNATLGISGNSGYVPTIGNNYCFTGNVYEYFGWNIEPRDSADVLPNCTIITNTCLPAVNFTLTPDTMPHTWDAYPAYSSNVTNARWYWGDGSYTFGLYPSHTYAIAGSYNICVTAYSSCADSTTSCQNDTVYRTSYSSMVYLNVKNSATGISQISGLNSQISIYPNPNNGSFVIEPSSATKQSMQVYDVTGKLVLSQTINGKTSIDASGLNEGVYNISLQSNEGVVNKRLVIVR